jgi:hypothetical protein
VSAGVSPNYADTWNSGQKTKPTTAGPGRPTGTTRPPRTRYPVGKKKPTTDKPKATKAKNNG